jgi:hypothetical protein
MKMQIGYGALIYFLMPYAWTTLEEDYILTWEPVLKPV